MKGYIGVGFGRMWGLWGVGGGKEQGYIERGVW